jgi:hypothetical protein
MLAALPSANGEAMLLQMRSCLAHREFDVVKQKMREAIAADPESIWPRVLLSHALLQEAKDWVAAEQVLRDILRLAPNDIEARNNLEVLLRQKSGCS